MTMKRSFILKAAAPCTLAVISGRDL